MRNPRLTDFQPEPRAPQLSSPLDDMPAIERQPQAEVLSMPSAPDGPPAPTGGRTLAGPSAPPFARTPGRRVITRYSFEFYQDQIEQLRRLDLEQRVKGEKGSMSEMVRDAIDAYLARKEDESPR